MGRKRRRSLIKWLHKWPSLVIVLFIILWACSGVILNHRHIFSSLDVNRDYLPGEHQYRSWNNASVRGSVRIDSNLLWFYGNTGVWQFNESDQSWLDRRDGFHRGADHHKVHCMLLSSKGNIYAGTRFGLHIYDKADECWNEVPFPHDDEHVVDLAEIRDSLWILTRSHLWKIPLEGEIVFSQVSIPAPTGYDNKVGLFKTLWVIHSGAIYGQIGKLIVDLVALVFVFLALSGLIYFFFPRIAKRRKKKAKSSGGLSRWTRLSVKWHNKVGIWLVAILIVTATTGMFLRPPLLIAIASGRVGKIPFSVLDDGNPWYDQLRRILYYEENDRLLIATSEGIYGANSKLKDPPEYIYPQPPASVMGYNVFTQYDSGNILVGSFSGLFLWHPESGVIHNYISGQLYINTMAPASPLSADMVSGYHVDRMGREYVFDYNKGVIWQRHRTSFPEMPVEISEARMPLWNFALEVHTARLFKPLIGDFYILFIPLFGLSVLVILTSGIILWIRKYMRRPKRR